MREVTINGKTVKLESGKTPAANPLGREKSDIRLLLEAMKDGESVALPINPKTISSMLNNVGKAVGSRFAYRTEGEGIRIYRMAGQTGNRSANAAARNSVSPIRQEQRTGTWA